MAEIIKLLLIADPSSPHTIRWANSLTSFGMDVSIFGLNEYDSSQYDKNIKIEVLKMPSYVISKTDGSLSKTLYLFAFPKLKKLIRSKSFHIVHSHYATSYGLLGSLLNFHPFLVSVWGNDVFDFPLKSNFHSRILAYTLNKADYVFSTSNHMAAETHKYTSKTINVIPFGIDINKFKPFEVDSVFDSDDIVIGTAKLLEPNYGIENLIASFSQLRKRIPGKSIKLLIVGGGSLYNNFSKLISELKIENDVILTGRKPYTEIPKYYNMIDIAVLPSINESFGVSALEASSCGKPVVVTNVGGLPEIIVNGLTGIIIEPNNTISLTDALEKLVLDDELRLKMGRYGRERAVEYFDIDKTTEKMIKFYIESIKYN